MKHFSFFIAVLFCFATFISCGSEGNDNTERDNPENGSGNVSQSIDGEWAYYEQQGNTMQGAVYLKFEGGNGIIATYDYNSYSEEFTVNAYTEFTYNYYANLKEINVVYSPSGSTDKWTILDLSANSITLNMYNTNITFQKLNNNQGGSNGGSGNSISYAPDDASGYHITAITDFTNYSTTLDLYFNSNYSVSSASYYSTFALISASYEKTGSNTAKITYTYSTSSGTNSTTLQLNFTSENGGTTKYSNGKEGRFTIAKESSYVVASAPESIAYKKFTIVIANVLEEWYQFGSQTGSSVRVTSFDPGLGSSSSYSIVRCTYNKMGTKNAELVIETRFMSSSSTTISTYSLTFRDSRSGTYSCYSTSPGNRFAEDKTTTGNFTLE